MRKKQKRNLRRHCRTILIAAHHVRAACKRHAHVSHDQLKTTIYSLPIAAPECKMNTTIRYTCTVFFFFTPFRDSVVPTNYGISVTITWNCGGIVSHNDWTCSSRKEGGEGESGDGGSRAEVAIRTCFNNQNAPALFY